MGLTDLSLIRKGSTLMSEPTKGINENEVEVRERIRCEFLKICVNYTTNSVPKC